MDRLNVLLVVMDTARFDVIRNSNLTPNIHQIAEDATAFTDVHSNAPWTLPSHASIFTGKYPSEHGVGVNKREFAVTDDLISLLGTAGYETVAFSNNPWISPDFGFDQFDTFYPCWQLFRRGDDLAETSQTEATIDQVKQVGKKLVSWNAPFTLINAAYMKTLEGKYDSGAALTNYRLKRWMNKRDRSTPFFAFVNYMEPHLEYDPPETYQKELLTKSEVDRAKSVNQDPWAHVTGSEEMSKRDFDVLRQLYRAEVHYLDKRIGNLWDTLDETGMLEDTIVVITGDHGENIGEAGLMDHQYSLNEALTHVPLYIYDPERQGGEDVDDVVELRDLYPSILDIAGIEDSPEHSLMNPDRTQREHAISEYLRPQPTIETLCERYGVSYDSVSQYDKRIKKITEKSHALVYDSDGNSDLYDRSAERFERTSDPEISDRLLTALHDSVGDFSELSSDPSVEVSSRLEDLGYL